MTRASVGAKQCSLAFLLKQERDSVYQTVDTDGCGIGKCHLRVLGRGGTAQYDDGTNESFGA